MGGAKMGFFAWIREGVRRAVLLGFSDAITEIGHRQDGEELGGQLASSLQQSAAIEGATKSTGTVTLAPPPGRKRLGKSLEQIRNEKAA
jgi:hypothetical protein